MLTCLITCVIACANEDPPGRVPLPVSCYDVPSTRRRAMDRVGTYRGYDIAVSLHSDGRPKTPKWHSSIQISPVGRAATEPCFTTEPSYGTVSEARNRAIRIARFVIDERPNAAPIGDDDLLDE
jgi:hypothetical protein